MRSSLQIGWRQVVEALTTAVTHMHPEVQVALVSYSHRIGIYKYAAILFCTSPYLFAVDVLEKQ